MEINDIARQHFEWVRDRGWHNKTVLEELALICSEVGEAVNECRGESPSEKFGSELADIVLRTVNVALRHGIDIDAEIQAKMAINRTRTFEGKIK